MVKNDENPFFYSHIQIMISAVEIREKSDSVTVTMSPSSRIKANFSNSLHQFSHFFTLIFHFSLDFFLLSNMCDFPFLSFLTKPTEREENVIRKAKFCGASRIFFSLYIGGIQKIRQKEKLLLFNIKNVCP